MGYEPPKKLTSKINAEIDVDRTGLRAVLSFRHDTVDYVGLLLGRPFMIRDAFTCQPKSQSYSPTFNFVEKITTGGDVPFTQQVHVHFTCTETPSITSVSWNPVPVPLTFFILDTWLWFASLWVSWQEVLDCLVLYISTAISTVISRLSKHIYDCWEFCCRYESVWIWLLSLKCTIWIKIINNPYNLLNE